MFSKQDLRTLHTALARSLPPAPSLPRTAAEVVEVGRVLAVVERALRSAAPSLERGPLVFEWRVPRLCAPRMNELSYWQPWQRTKLKRTHDTDVAALLAAQPLAALHGAARRRWLRMTRFSPKAPDEVSVDGCGGKMPVDALVRHGVLHDDDMEWTHREAHWEKTKPGNTHLLIEVFELAVEGVETAPPKDTQVTQVTQARGAFTRALGSP